ncbi:MAG: PAS domain S-box protein, partial [Magnetococcales bacterium]|nr:PAS domain S-box protein [Magnetococcales bacterium]
IYGSRALGNLLGLETDQLKGQFSTDFYVDPEDRNRILVTLNEQNFDVVRRDIQLRRIDGSRVWVQGIYKAITFSGENALAVGILDITQRRRMEQNLRITEARFRELFNAMSSGVAVYRPVDNGQDFAFVDYNRAGSTMDGVPPEGVIGRRVTQVFPGVEAFGLLDVFRRVMETGTPEHHPVRLYEDNKLKAWRENFVFKSPSGEIYAVYDDVTKRKRAEEKVQRLNQELELRVRERTLQLERANSELESFTYSVSHDLRAPLRSIEGFGTLMAMRCGEELSEEGRHFLERINTGCSVMGRLIDDMLQLSRISQEALKLARIDLSRLVEEIRERLAEQEPNRDVTWSIQPNVVAKGDERFVRMVLDNLLGNAWKYTSRTARAEIQFGQESGGEEGGPILLVKDNGAGFNMHHADRLFVPFQRLHKASEFDGHGIGLATVQRIIHRHGGRIWAESEPGKGALFRFTFS